MNIIYETLVGSHLYGTSTPESDLDIAGVFIPTREQLLGMLPYKDDVDASRKLSAGPRNGAGDVDIKYHSLRRFLQLASQGQPGALEILFSCHLNAIKCTDTWLEIQQLRDFAIISKKCITPFLGFAQSQAEKMVRRGEKYNQITEMIKTLEFTPSDFLKETTLSGAYAQEFLDDHVLSCHKNDHGFTLFTFAGSNYDAGISLKIFLKMLRVKEESYGSRSKAAALEHLDYKSLLHCMRLLFQAQELLAEHTLTFPRPTSEREFLMRIKNREWPPEGHDVFADVTERIENIREVYVPKSGLREKPDVQAIIDFCVNTHLRSIA